jgi:proteasome assembly chaperone (PAC2) family protein
MGAYLKEKPSLKKPVLIGSCPGMGMQFAEISIQATTFISRMVWESSVNTDTNFTIGRGKSDLIVCSGEIQPQSINTIHYLANQVLDVAEEFGTKKVFTIAAVPKIRVVEPQVFGVVNRPELGKCLNAEGVQLAG